MRTQRRSPPLANCIVGIHETCEGPAAAGGGQSVLHFPSAATRSPSSSRVFFCQRRVLLDFNKNVVASTASAAAGGRLGGRLGSGLPGRVPHAPAVPGGDGRGARPAAVHQRAP